MRLLVLGGSGMLGRAAALWLLPRFDDVLVSYRGAPPAGVPPERLVSFDASRDDVANLPAADWLFNAIGLVKQRTDVSDEEMWDVNARFPKRLAASAERRGARLVHVTTDCVYSGRRGGYVESDPHDAADVYGRSKSAGEAPSAMNLRTSIVGEEAARRLALLEWVRGSAPDPVPGYTNHVWSGMTTLQLVTLFERIVREDLFAPGLRHVFTAPISKRALVEEIVRVYGVGKRVVPVAAPVAIDRSLESEHDLSARLALPPIGEQLLRLRAFHASSAAAPG